MTVIDLKATVREISPQSIMNPSAIPRSEIRVKLTIREYDIASEASLVLLNGRDCEVLGIDEGDRVIVTGDDQTVAVVSVSRTLVQEGEILATPGLLVRCGALPGSVVDVTASHAPESVRHIRGKMDGERLTGQMISEIVDDVVGGHLSQMEISAWLTALHINGMDLDETAAYAKAMASTGTVLSFGDRRVFDFHSFGGLPGNKITPVVVSIVAAAGLTIPKLSSRAISSACGTADFVETFCRVDLDSDEVRRVTESVGGVFSWTGATDLGPAGDLFIRVQRPLGIDPRPQMLASIMSKKVAAGATDLVMDIPLGTESKVRSVEEARSYTRDLMDLGERLGIRVECAVTYAEQPLGQAVGPILEARECMQVLEGRGPSDVAEKACICAGMILEMAGTIDGHGEARRILGSGEALEIFRRIVGAQGGDPDTTSEDMVPGMYSEDIVSPRSGFVRRISNKAIVAVAKAAGAPSDKGAGVMVRKKQGSKVSEGDVLLTVYADSEAKLCHAMCVADSLEPITAKGMVMGHIGHRDRKN